MTTPSLYNIFYKIKKLLLSLRRNPSCDTNKIIFPLSVTRVVPAFDLVHIDIWGPFSINYIHEHKYFLTILDASVIIHG